MPPYGTVPALTSFHVRQLIGGDEEGEEGKGRRMSEKGKGNGKQQGGRGGRKEGERSGCPQNAIDQASAPNDTLKAFKFSFSFL